MGLSSEFGATPSHGAGVTRRADGRAAAIHISRERLGGMVAIGTDPGAHRGQRGAGANIPFSGGGKMAAVPSITPPIPVHEAGVFSLFGLVAHRSII